MLKSLVGFIHRGMFRKADCEQSAVHSAESKGYVGRALSMVLKTVPLRGARSLPLQTFTSDFCMSHVITISVLLSSMSEVANL